MQCGITASIPILFVPPLILDPIVLLSRHRSCVALALDTPDLDANSTLALVLARIDIAVAALFVLEGCVKAIAMGAIGHRNAYLRNPWNQVCVSAENVRHTPTSFRLLSRVFDNAPLPPDACCQR